jgi:hypothetical protein
MREIRKSGSEGGAGQTNAPFLPLSLSGADANPSSQLEGGPPCPPKLQARSAVSPPSLIQARLRRKSGRRRSVALHFFDRR